MTKEFAIDRLKLFAKYYSGENKEVFELAIKALEEQPELHRYTKLRKAIKDMCGW